MTLLKESNAVAQSQLANAQSSLLAVAGDCDKYCHSLGVKKKRCGGLAALLCSFSSRLVDHTSLVDSVRGFLCQNGKCDIDVCLQVTSAAVRECTVGIRYVTPNIVDTHRLMPCQYVSSIFMHLNGRLEASDSERFGHDVLESPGSRRCATSIVACLTAVLYLNKLALLSPFPIFLVDVMVAVTSLRSVFTSVDADSPLSCLSRYCSLFYQLCCGHSDVVGDAKLQTSVIKEIFIFILTSLWRCCWRKFASLSIKRNVLCFLKLW